MARHSRESGNPCGPSFPRKRESMLSFSGYDKSANWSAADVFPFRGNDERRRFPFSPDDEPVVFQSLYLYQSCWITNGHV